MYWSYFCTLPDLDVNILIAYSKAYSLFNFNSDVLWYTAKIEITCPDCIYFGLQIIFASFQRK